MMLHNPNTRLVAAQGQSMRFGTLCVQVNAGIGSQLHVLGLALAVAMDTDRILLLNTDVEEGMYTNDPYCGAQMSCARVLRLLP